MRWIVHSHNVSIGGILNEQVLLNFKYFESLSFVANLINMNILAALNMTIYFNPMGKK